MQGLQAQDYSPAMDLQGMDAIHSGDERFISWAIVCDLERGPGLITHPDSIEVTNGEAVNATGQAGNESVSLGDGGRATLFFELPLGDGPGADFAVFENSFDGTFLELGFVEVSSDGQNFVRFASGSLTPVDIQVGTFGTLAPENLHNLAGKYMAGWGTPFDLAELEDSSGLDIQHVLAVRVIDVIGILDDSLGSKDAAGRLINDPFPTPFESGGFDLDGIGVINQSSSSQARLSEMNTLKVYPVPCKMELFLEDPHGIFQGWSLLDLSGRVIRQGILGAGIQRIDLGDLSGGIYLLQTEAPQTGMVKKILKIER